MADDLNRDAGKGPHTNDIIHHDNHPGVGDHVGEAAGGISGVLAGAAIGSAGGPIGTIIGGIAGAIGGWWSGRAISEAATKFTHSDDDHYRKHYETSSARLADRTYEDVRPAYQLGHVASHNPDYASREFEDVERDLQAGWSDDLRTKHGEWAQVRGYARDAYARGRATVGQDTTVDRHTGAPTTADLGTSGSSGFASGAAAGSGLAAAGLGDRIANKVDDLKDRVDGNPASRPGPDATDANRGYAGSSAGGLGDRIANKVDDLKDRFDGNPASRPGPDATDTNRGGMGTGMTGSGMSGTGMSGTAGTSGTTGGTLSGLGDRLADKADDLKDRVDGNPASRPGPDATDSDRRF